MIYKFDDKSLTAKVIHFKDSVEENNIIVPDRILYKGRDYVVTEIGERAFEGCTSIQSIVIPSSVTKIEKSAFSGCSALQYINIPASVTEIGALTFLDCTALQSIVIPASVTKIGSGAFSGLENLKSIAILNLVPPEIAYSMCYIPPCTLHVPQEAVEEYSTREPWCNFKEIKGLE